MEKYGEEDYARSGFVATETIELTEGPLPDFSHSIEPHLRKLGLPTSLQKGVVTLLNNHVVCKKGKTLTPEQARILVIYEGFYSMDRIRRFYFYSFILFFSFSEIIRQGVGNV